MNFSLWNSRQHLGLFLGLILFVILLIIPAPEGLSAAGWRTAAVATLMATWWITEAIPIAATALIPIVLFPLLGILDIDNTTTPYANPLIFLFLGGFVIAMAMQRWNLHRRIALNIVNRIGTQPTSIIFGFLVATAFLSMWVSNTATAMMMLPIAISVVDLAEERMPADMQKEKMNFELVLILSIAYGSNIGGIGTLIGTPPNALLSGFMLENYGLEISFAQWMLAGIPMVVLSIPLIFFALTRWIYPVKLEKLPGGYEIIQRELAELGPTTSAEKKVAVVFVLTALCWITRPLLTNYIPGLSDAGIAMTAALAFFVIPENFSERVFLLNWKEAAQLPWGVLLLFGGGLSLASAISKTGLAKWVGTSVSLLQSWPVMLMVLLVILLMVFTTEITSNTATTAAFLPILASVAVGIGQNPLLLAIPATISASLAFMLPVATPPNAIIYASGKITIPQMSKAGIWLNLLFAIFLLMFCYAVILYVFGIQINVLPGWAG